MTEKIKKGYTRVSQILGQWDKFGHIDPDVLSKKADLGTNVHACIYSYLTSGLYGIDLDYLCYFESFLKWHETTQAKYIRAEERLYCERFKITGQVDGVYQIPSKKGLTIVDYKTSAAESPKIWPLQAAFYHWLCKVNDIDILPDVIFLKLDPKSNLPKAYIYTVDESLMNIALSALNCYRWLNSK